MILILDKTVKIKTSGKSIKYYRSLGYECGYHTEIEVKIEDLQKTSRAIVNIRCDYCGEKYKIPYVVYTKSTSSLNKYACKNCKNKKEKEIFLQKYGVNNPSKIKEFQEKVYKTNLERYGVKHPLQNRDILNKRNETCIERYGTTNPLSLECFKEKSKQRNLEIRGVENPGQSLEVRKKMINTLYKQGTQKVSIQQKYLHNLYGGQLNYPVGYFNVDICIEDKIIIEYDGGGHKLNVITGRETQEEFDQKEIVRYNVIKNKGYKQIRIISEKDYLPLDEILLQILEQAKEYFKTTIHTWVEYNIDSSTMRNAENKEGIYYDYGDLRKIKKTS